MKSSIGCDRGLCVGYLAILQGLDIWKIMDVSKLWSRDDLSGSLTSDRFYIL